MAEVLVLVEQDADGGLKKVTSELITAARALGSDLDSPFGILAFLALSVIPEARVTDRGFLRLDP